MLKLHASNQLHVHLSILYYTHLRKFDTAWCVFDGCDKRKTILSIYQMAEGVAETSSQRNYKHTEKSGDYWNGRLITCSVRYNFTGYILIS